MVVLAADAGVDPVAAADHREARQGTARFLALEFLAAEAGQVQQAP